MSLLFTTVSTEPHRESNRLQGFVWKADDSAIQAAQENYDNLKRETNLDSQIIQLEEYKKLWEETIKSYQKGVDETTTANILGSNWKTSIANLDTSQIGMIESGHRKTSRELDVDFSGSTAYQLNQLDELSKAVSDAYDSINEYDTEYQDNQDKLTKFMSSSYTTRLSDVQKYANNYKSELEKHKNDSIDFSESIKNTRIETEDNIGSLSESITTFTDKIKEFVDKSLVQFKRLTGVSVEGSEPKDSTFKDFKIIDPLKNILQKFPNMNVEAFNSFGANAVSMNPSFYNPIDDIRKDFQKAINTITASQAKTQPVVNNVNIGDIIVPNTVGNVDDLMDGIISQLPQKASQIVSKIYKK